MKRLKLLLLLAQLEDAAFDLFVMALLPANMGASATVWPDGLVGLGMKDRETIRAVQETAKEWNDL